MAEATTPRLTKLLSKKDFRLSDAREIGKKIIDQSISIESYISLSISLKEKFPERALWGLEQFVAQKKRKPIPEAALQQLFDWLTMDGRSPGELRHGLKAISVSDLSDQMIEKVLEPCFTWLASPLAGGATRIYSMHIIDRISQAIPELRPELLMILEHHFDDGSVWFKHQARKVHPDLANR